MASVGPQGHRGGRGSGEVILIRNLVQASGSAQNRGQGLFPGATGGKTSKLPMGPKPRKSPHTPEGNRFWVRPPPSERDRPDLLYRPAETTSARTQDGRQRRRALGGSFGLWDRRSLGGGGASSPQGLEDACPAGVLPHLRRCAGALRARKSLRGGRKKRINELAYPGSPRQGPPLPESHL